MKRVLSLGAGVQSSVLLLMSCRGELPKLDCAIFSDTQYEPPAVYEHLAWLEAEAAKASIPVHRVTAGNIRDDAIEFRQNRRSADGKRFASIPLFILNGDGSQGKVRRQCTSEYKIEPIERFLKREVLGLKPGERAPRTPQIEQWMGITKDESGRASHPYAKKRKRADGSIVKSAILWKKHAYPLMNTTLWNEVIDGRGTIPTGGDFDGPAMHWNRTDCINWLKANYPERDVPRSACICCPFRSNKEWREMRDNDPASWADAIDFDKQIRVADREGQSLRKILVGLPFVHRSLKPLDEVDLELEAGASLFGEECEGMCGV